MSCGCCKNGMTYTISDFRSFQVPDVYLSSFWIFHEACEAEKRKEKLNY